MIFRIFVIVLLSTCCVHAQSDSLMRENKMDSLIRRGDFYFSNCEGDSAQFNYDLALIFRNNGNAHKQEHIKDREAEMQIPEWCVESHAYETAITRGDKAFGEKKYSEAKAAYYEAHQMKPAEQLPIQKILECDKAMQEAETRDIEPNYNRAIQQADSAMRLSDYRTAKLFYRKASSLKPMEQYPKDQIKACDSHAVCGTRDYHDAVYSADSLFLKKQFVDSKRKYQEAAALKTAELYPKEQIKKCDDSIAANRLKLEYDFYIKQADSLFAAKEYRQAKIWYGEAVRLKPAEQYPQGKMKECDAKLEEDK